MSTIHNPSPLQNARHLTAYQELPIETSVYSQRYQGAPSGYNQRLLRKRIESDNHFYSNHFQDEMLIPHINITSRPVINDNVLFFINAIAQQGYQNTVKALEQGASPMSNWKKGLPD